MVYILESKSCNSHCDNCSSHSISWKKSGNNPIWRNLGNMVDKVKLTIPVFSSRPRSHSLYECYHYRGVGEVLYCRPSLPAFFKYSLFFTNATSRQQLLWFSRFISFYGEIYQCWSTKHKGLAFIVKGEIWLPKKNRITCLQVFVLSLGYHFSLHVNIWCRNEVLLWCDFNDNQLFIRWSLFPSDLSCSELTSPHYSADAIEWFLYIL